MRWQAGARRLAPSPRRPLPSLNDPRTPPLVSDRILVERAHQADRAAGDGLPMLLVELAQPPCSGEPADQPEEHNKADPEFHRDLCSELPQGIMVRRSSQSEDLAKPRNALERWWRPEAYFAGASPPLR